MCSVFGATRALPCRHYSFLASTPRHGSETPHFAPNPPAGTFRHIGISCMFLSPRFLPSRTLWKRVCTLSLPTFGGTGGLIIMRTLEAIDDSVVCKHILHALQGQPETASADINVAVDGGVATLTGVVHSYFAKLTAEDTAKHVPGVEGLANDIQVKLGKQASDPEIARHAVHALREQPGVSGITVTVRDG